jgi:hypothetical protein
VRKLEDAGMGNWDAMIDLGLTKTIGASGMAYARITFRLVRTLRADQIEKLGQWVRALWPPRPRLVSGTQRATVLATTAAGTEDLYKIAGPTSAER